jgi:hypothetical protein
MMPPLFMRGTRLAGHQAERRRVWLRPAGAQIGTLFLGDLDRIAEMIAVAVRHQDKIDLADLAEVLELRRNPGGTHDPGIDHDDLAARRGELEGGLAVPQQFGLALRIGGAGECQASRGDDGKNTEDHERGPPVCFAEPSTIFRSERAHFPVSRQSPNMCTAQ